MSKLPATSLLFSLLFSLPALAPWLLWAAPTEAQDAPSTAEVEAFGKAVDEIEHHFNGTLVAGGSVLDEQGRPLDSVSLEVAVARFDPTAESLQRVEKSRQVVTGAFRISCQRCSDLRLRFDKEGYHGEMVTVSTRERSDPLSEARPAKQLGTLQVVLRPVVAPVRLETFRGRITAAPDSALTKVLPVPSSAYVDASTGDSLGRSSGRPSGSSSGLGRAVPLKSLREKASGDLPDFVRLSAELEGGALKTRRPWPSARPLAVAPALELAGDGGFRLYEPSSKRVAEIWREMDEAPADGYSPRLELDPERDRPLYFYIRIGGRYGKGRVTPTSVDRGSNGQRVSAFVELRLNAEGGRGLEGARF